MATGVLAIAAATLGWHVLTWPLVVVEAVAYVVLWVLNGLRLARYPGRVLADLQDHARGPGFFTVVAATCILGTTCVVVLQRPALARLLWVLGVLLWVVVMYAFFASVVTRENKPSLEAGINGAWLIATVATQSISVLGCFVAESFGAYREIVLFVALAMYLLGAMLYLSIITLIFYRFTFVHLTGEELTPPYWISMGAVAITTLAGSVLILQAGQWALGREIRPFLAGFTPVFWAARTRRAPMLLLL